MAWIQSHQKLEKSGKLLVLARALAINRYQAIGHLQAFWWWCIDNAKDGDVTRYDSVTLAKASGWHEFCKDDFMSQHGVGRKDEEFMDAMVEAGFLDKTEEKVLVHNWDYYTLEYFKTIEKTERNREQTKERVRAFRGRNANVTQDGALHVTPCNKNVTQCNAPIEEYRRVEKSREITPKDRHLDFVLLTKEEEQRLIAKLKDRLPEYLQRLNGYIGQIGEKKAATKYVSHYHTILNWHRKDVETPLAPKKTSFDIMREKIMKAEQPNG